MNRSPLKRRTPLRRVSKKRRKALAEYAKNRETVLALACGRCEVPACGRPATDTHHLRFRSRGGGHGIENLAAVCRDHHAAIHAGDPALAGFRVSRHQGARP